MGTAGRSFIPPGSVTGRGCSHAPLSRGVVSGNKGFMKGAGGKAMTKNIAGLDGFICKGIQERNLPSDPLIHCFRETGMEQPVERANSFVFGEMGVPGRSRCTFVERPKVGDAPTQTSRQPRQLPGAGQCGRGFELELPGRPPALRPPLTPLG